MDLMSREFLRELHSEALARADTVANPNWERMYVRLADAAETADAYIARAEAAPQQPSE